MVQLGESAAARAKARPAAAIPAGDSYSGPVRSLDQLATVAGMMEQRAGRAG